MNASKWLSVAVAAVAAGTVGAANLYVSPDAAAGGDGSESAPFATIAAAVAAAKAGDAVLLTEGTHVLTDEITVSKAVTIRSADGLSREQVIVVNDEGRSTAGNRLFTLGNANAKLQGLTFKDVYITARGAAAYINSGKMVDCHVTNCKASGGGGVILNSGTDASVEGCLFEKCEDGGENGTAICALWDCLSVVRDTTIRDCTVTCGGSNKGGVVKGAALYNCVIENNSCKGNYTVGLVSCKAYDCVIRGNTSGGSTVRALLDGCSEVRRCEIIGNKGTGTWALITDSTLYDCVVAENEMPNGTCGIMNRTKIYNCTVVDNKVTSACPACWSSDSTSAVVYNSIVRNFIGATDVENNVLAGIPVAYSRVDAARAASGTGNISDDPKLGGDWTLAKSSPCVNAGSDDAAYCKSSTDLTGAARKVGAAVDMGCRELPITELTPVDYYVSPTGDDAAAGTAAAPFATLAKALSVCWGDDRVWVAAGNYVVTECVEVRRAVAVAAAPGVARGAVTFTNAAETDVPANRIFFLDAAGASVTGVTVTDARVNSGSDTLFAAGSVFRGSGAGFCVNKGTVRDCVVSGCRAEYGGGIRMAQNADARVLDSEITGCTGGYGAAAVYAAAVSGGAAPVALVSNTVIRANNPMANGVVASVELRDCTVTENENKRHDAHLLAGIESCHAYNCKITNNKSYGRVAATNSKLHRCEITGNVSTGGYGILADCDTFDSLIAGNRADNFSPAYGLVTRGSLTGCTAVNNTFADNNNLLYGAVTCRNSILWNNTVTGTDTVKNYNAGSESLINYCCTFPLPPGGEGNVAADPKFMRTGYRLAAGSPCIDAGNNDYRVSDFDLAGTDRVKYGVIDIGCREAEFVGTVITVR